MKDEYNPHTISKYSKWCQKCIHIRLDKYAGWDMEDIDVCGLSGKPIKFDDNNYPIECLLKYRKER